ncbi:cytochrome P450 2C39 [Trichonephila clavipes]|nr:cytochrome P450 2C39 [Trichonephila clavipes]
MKRSTWLTIQRVRHIANPAYELSEFLIELVVVVTMRIAQEEGEAWTQHRKFFLQTSKKFGFGKLEMEERIHDEIKQMIEILRKEKNADFSFSLAHAVSSVISQVLFSKKFDRDQTFVRIQKSMMKFIPIFNSNINMIVGYPFDLMFLLFPRMRTVKEGIKEIRKFTDSAVEEQIRTHDPSFSRGYVDAYLQYRNELLAKEKPEAALFNGRIRIHYEKLSEFERGLIIGLKEAGWTNRRIALHMERSDAIIRRCWQEWVNNGRFQSHDGSGQPRATAYQEDGLILDQLLQRLIRHQPSDVRPTRKCPR